MMPMRIRFVGASAAHTARSNGADAAPKLSAAPLPTVRSRKSRRLSFDRSIVQLQTIQDWKNGYHFREEIGGMVIRRHAGRRLRPIQDRPILPPACCAKECGSGYLPAHG